MHPAPGRREKLADSGAIERVGAGEHGTGEYSVRSGENTYTVVLPADPYAVEGYLCSCTLVVEVPRYAQPPSAPWRSVLLYPRTRRRLATPRTALKDDAQKLASSFLPERPS